MEQEHDRMKEEIKRLTKSITMVMGINQTTRDELHLMNQRYKHTRKALEDCHTAHARSWTRIKQLTKVLEQAGLSVPPEE